MSVGLKRVEEAWAIEWRSKNRLDGETRHLVVGYVPDRLQLFRTRREAREHAELEWGYIRKRPDLRTEPHGWQMPRAVRVRVTIEALLPTTRRKPMGEPDVVCWFCQGAREFHRLSRTPGIPERVRRPLPCPECRAEEFKALYRNHGSQGEKGDDK